MSFILDQLKKSGRKRELELAMRSKAGSLNGETAEASQTDSRPLPGRGIHRRDIYLLVFLAATSAAVLGGFMLLRGSPENRQAPVVSREAQVHAPVSSEPKAEIVRPKPELPVDRGTDLPPRSGSSADPKKAAHARTDAEKRPERKGKTSTVPMAAEIRNPPEAANQGQTAVPSPPEKSGPRNDVDDAHRTPYLNELPASVRKALPPIRITSHLYRGNSRLVSINGRIMSEGVSMDDGLFLEKITPEGVILSFSGHRFRLRAD